MAKAGDRTSNWGYGATARQLSCQGIQPSRRLNFSDEFGSPWGKSYRSTAIGSAKISSITLIYTSSSK
jgi:hypothetical protein